MLSTEAKPDPGSETNSNEAGSNENQTVSLREPPSTARYPTLPSSVTMPDFPIDQKGDPLIQLSDTEWEHGVQAFPNEFINLTREEDRVSVFAAPEKAAEYQAKLEDQRRRRRLARQQRRMEEAMEKGFRPLETFPELVDAVTRTLNEDRVQNHGVQVCTGYCSRHLDHPWGNVSFEALRGLLSGPMSGWPTL